MSKPICTMTCEDCGKFIVVDSEYISVFVLEDSAQAITRCAHCDRAVLQTVPLELIEKLSSRGVKVFDWLTGSEYEFL